jgi:hypothetical protein
MSREIAESVLLAIARRHSTTERERMRERVTMLARGVVRSLKDRINKRERFFFKIKVQNEKEKRILSKYSRK